MRQIPTKIKEQLKSDRFMGRCVHLMRPGHVCDGPITWEHALLYAGRQINEPWAIIPCCRSMNVGVSGVDKDFNRYVAMARATEEDFAKYPKRNWKQELERLKKIFPEINLQLGKETLN